MKTWLKKLKRQWSINSVLICTQGDISIVPPLPQNDQLVIEEMQMSDLGDIAKWLTIHNDAFLRQWVVNDFQQNVINHPYLLIKKSFFILVDREPVGSISVGVFRQNEKVGIGHYMALKRQWQGKGFGKYLILLKLNVLNQFGLTTAEGETTLNRHQSIYLHFSLGFQPKKGLDYWNTPDTSAPLIKMLAWRKLNRMYHDWLSKNPT